MKIQVLVRANAKQEKVEVVEEKVLRVSVKAPPKEGKANEAVIRLLAKHFGVSQRAVRLLSGATSKRKWFEI